MKIIYWITERKNKFYKYCLLMIWLWTLHEHYTIFRLQNYRKNEIMIIIMIYEIIYLWSYACESLVGIYYRKEELPEVANRPDIVTLFAIHHVASFQRQQLPAKTWKTVCNISTCWHLQLKNNCTELLSWWFLEKVLPKKYAGYNLLHVRCYLWEKLKYCITDKCLLHI